MTKTGIGVHCAYIKILSFESEETLMNRSFTYILIAAAVFEYFSFGWLIGYYLSNPHFLASDFGQILINPFGVTLTASSYNLESQIIFIFFGLPIVLMSWAAFIVLKVILGLKVLFLLFAGMGTLFVH